MVDEHSRNAFHNFLEPFLTSPPSEYDQYTYLENGMMSDIGIRAGLLALIDIGEYTLEQLTVKLAQTEKVVFPASRLKEFIETGRWPCYMDIGGRSSFFVEE